MAAVSPIQNHANVDADTSAKSEKEKYRPPWGALGIILCVELCERLTYYTLASSQKTYLNKQLGYTSSSAASMNSVFSMICYMWCLPGGILADMMGRYKVIVSLAVIYAIGTMMLVIATYNGVEIDMQVRLKGLFMLGAFGLIPLGTGGIKPNICNFGADQIGDATEAQRNTQKSFFSYFYLSINVGVLIAFGFLVNVTTGGLPALDIPKSQGYFAAYLAAAVAIIVAVVVFVAGTCLYERKPGGGLDGCISMVKSLASSVRHGRSWQSKVAAVGWLLLPVFFALTVAAAVESGSVQEVSSVGYVGNATSATATLEPTRTFTNVYEEHCSMRSASLANQSEPDAQLADAGRRLKGTWFHLTSAQESALLTNLALAAGTISCIALVVAHLNNDWILPLATDAATFTDAAAFTIEEVRAGFAPVPIIVVVNIAYNLSYNAMNNAMPSQACQMNTILGGQQLNGAFFNLADAIAIIALTPLFESLLYPFVSRLQGKPIGISFKLVTGLVVVALANIVAAVFELRRRQAPLMCWEEASECAPNGIHMRDISALWIFIPFFLIGASEILVNPCMYYFAYTMAPPRVRSLVQAFQLFFCGAVSNAFTAVVTKVAFPDDLDTGHLEYYYYINAVAALLGVLIFFYLRGRGAATCSQDSQESVASEVRTEPPSV